jgi:hypothetical protein
MRQPPQYIHDVTAIPTRDLANTCAKAEHPPVSLVFFLTDMRAPASAPERHHGVPE